MCMYVAHWNIFMVNKRDLQPKKKKAPFTDSINAPISENSKKMSCVLINIL